MPRQARLDAPGTLHHVIARGIERRRIFAGEADYEDMMGRFEKVVASTGVEVLAWALIPNHFHLLLRTGPVGLPTVMRRVMTGYASGFNRRHRRHGHLFQNRYKSIVCEQEAYLLELVRYIHLNALRGRLVGSVEELAEYAYAGHSALMGRAERPWQATAEVLGRFGQTAGAARQGYEQFLREGVAQGRRPELVGGGLRRSCGAWLDLPTRKGRREPVAHDERVLGDPEFVADLLADADWERRQLLRARARAAIPELAERVAVLAEVSVDELRGGGKRPRVVEARAALAQVAIRELGHTGAALSRYLGVAASTVNRPAAAGELTPLAQRLLKVLSA